MKTGELWWCRLVNSVRFLDDIRDILIDGKSAVMNFSGDIPWFDDMLYTLEQKLSFLTETHSFMVHDVSGVNKDVGKYLFEHFCSESERKNYWPDKSYECFLATNDNIPLNHRIFCITGINSSNAGVWMKSVNEYLENRNSDDRCIFILIVRDANTGNSKFIGNINYSDYVTDYDCLMLCLTLLSSEKCSSIRKQYVSEIASAISGNSVEIAGLLASEGLELAKDPLNVSEKVFADNNIKMTSFSERINTAVWEAQIKIVFPRLEDFRRNITQKYYTKIQGYLPITSSSGEEIGKVTEVEIGQLFFICGKGKFLEKSDFDLLCKMRDARNLLAHKKPIEYKNLVDLKII